MTFLRNLTTLVLCFAFIGGKQLPAQNWAPIHNGWQLNYSLNDSGAVTHVIRIEDYMVTGGDSLFYLNTRAAYCDTCGNPCYYTPCAAIIDHPNFLRKEAFQDSSGAWWLQNPDTLRLEAQAALGQKWLYNPSTQDSAWVYALDSTHVLGQPDSAKWIAVSTGDTLVLSKEYGIARFSTDSAANVYDLIGIEGPDLGWVHPRLRDFFPYQVGDSMEYDFHTSKSTGMTYDWVKAWRRKYIVTDVYVGDDTVEVTLDVIGLNTPPVETWLFTKSNTRWWFQDVGTLGLMGDLDMLFQGVFYGMVSQGYDADNRFSRAVAMVPGGYGMPFLLMNGLSVNPHSPFSPSATPNIYFSQDFPPFHTAFEVTKVGRGFVERHASGFETIFIYRQEAWDINGDSGGQFTPDSVLLGNTPRTALVAQIFPNPSEGELRVELGRSIATGRLCLFDFQGREVWSQSVSGRAFRMDLSGLPKGLYVLRLDSPQGILTRKVALH